MNKQTKSILAEQHDLCMAYDKHLASTTRKARHLEDASPAQLAYLSLNGSYGEKMVATMLLEAIAKDGSPQPSLNVFPKGRWT